MKNFKMMLAVTFASVLFVPSVLAACDGDKTGKQASVTNAGVTQYCDSISDALDAANSNAVVTLLKDFEFTGSNQTGRVEIEDKNITFDFGGYKITAPNLPEAYATVVVKGTSNVTFTGKGGIEHAKGGSALLVTGTAAVVKIEGGEFIQSGDTSDGKNYAAVSIEDGTLNVAEKGAAAVLIDGGIGVFGTNPNLTVVSGTITAEDFAISGNGSTTTNSTINIQGGTIKSSGSAAIYNPQSGTLNITGGDIEGKIGIVARGGTVTISDNANITATGKEDEEYEVGDANDGSGKVKLPGGIGLIVDNTESYPHANAQVKGGNFTTEGDAVLAYKNETNADNNIKVSGGKFNQDIPTQYLDDDADVQQSEGHVVGKVYTITANTDKNGTVTVNKNAAVGENVKVSYVANKGYKLNKITVTYKKNGKETEVKVAEDGTFVMPEGNVKVNVTFVKVEVPVDNKPDEAPATLDNIFTYVVLAFGTLGTATIVSKKILNK